MDEQGSLFQHGSRWVRADFHLHTMADKEFAYEGDPNYFVSDYVAALLAADIRVGVITNHNKFVRDEFEQLRRHARRNDILLLPGVELSVQDGAAGVHMLIVFSEEWIAPGADHITTFLDNAFRGRTPQQYWNENENSDWNILEALQQLGKWGKDFFVVFAHVEDPKGLWRELGLRRIEQLAENALFRRYALGFQKVRTHEAEKGRLCRTKVRTALHDAYPAEVEGSDCKSIDEIGSKQGATYVKIGELSFDAVKYALLDAAHRVDAEERTFRHSHIRSVRFEGGLLDGKTVRFSPELNTFIGIRGSGKSAIIESIRYALGIELREEPERKYKDKLVRHILDSGGKVTVHAVNRHGQDYEVSRILHEPPEVRLNGEYVPGVSIGETVLRKPLYFGQKALSERGKDFEGGLVLKLIGPKLQAIAEEIDAQRQKVTAVIQQLEDLADAQEKKAEYKRRKQDAEHRLAFFAQHGVEEKLQRQVNFDEDIRKAEQIGSFAGKLAADIEQLADRYEDDLHHHGTYSSVENAAFFTEFFAVYDRLHAAYAQLRKAQVQAREAEKNLKKMAERLHETRRGLIEEFAAVERLLVQQFRDAEDVTIRPEEFRELKARRAQAAEMLALLSKQEQQQQSVRGELDKELASLDALWHKQFRQIKEELSRVTKNNSALGIEAVYKGDKEAFLHYMKAIFQGSGIRETAYRRLVEKYNDFRGMYQQLDKAAAIASQTNPSIFKQYFMTNLASLLTWQVPNRFIITFRGKELDDHSLGQQASALLLFVLNQGDHDVFIIDQPEDDLDNRTIYDDVIKLLRELKPRTQFIFATHNANISVLGDAEQVIRCVYGDGEMDIQSGSIDSPVMQQEIVDIMEGGQEAFEKRKRIYEIWKP